MPRDDDEPCSGQKPVSLRPHDLAQATPDAIPLHRTANPTRRDDTDARSTLRGVWKDAQQHKLSVNRRTVQTHPLKLGRANEPRGLWKSQTHSLRKKSAAPDTAAAGNAGAGAQACVCRA